MLKKHPVLATFVSVLTLALYIGLLYWVFNNVDAAPVNSISQAEINLSYPTTTREIEHGKIFATQDGGRSWKKIKASSTQSFSSLSCPSVKVCYMLANQASIFKTTDGGQTWQEKTVANNPYIRSISCPLEASCHAIIQNLNTRIIINSTDGALTWKTQPLLPNQDDYENLNCPQYLICYFTGGKGTIFTSTDAGSSWVKQNSGTDLNLLMVSCMSPLNCIMITDEDVILTTADGGKNWNAQRLAKVSHFSQLSCPTSQICYALARNADNTRANQLVATEDQGTSWKLLPATLEESYYSLSCSTGSICFLAGQAGTVTVTNDGGQSWTKKNVGINQSLSGIQCPSPDKCYVINTPGG